MMPQSKNDLFLYAILAVPFILLVITAYYINVVVPFSESRDYIKCEIARSFNESEARYWKSKLIKLYILLIPIVGKMLAKRMR